jgi:hypothetical protein
MTTTLKNGAKAKSKDVETKAENPTVKDDEASGSDDDSKYSMKLE